MLEKPWLRYTVLSIGRVYPVLDIGQVFRKRQERTQMETFCWFVPRRNSATRPDLKPIVDLHRSDGNGVPQHAEATGWYWLAGALGGLGESYHGGNQDPQRTADECLESLANHLRITREDACALANSIKSLYERGDAWTLGQRITSLLSPKRAARAAFQDFIEAQKPRWEQEARSAVETCLRPKPNPAIPNGNPKQELLPKPDIKVKPSIKPSISYTLYFTSSVCYRVFPLLFSFGIDPAAIEKPSPSRPGIYTANLFIPENILKDLLALMPNDPSLPDEFTPQPDPPPPYPPDFHGGI